MSNLEDLLVEFDEMGFEPTILCESPQEEVKSFRNRLQQALTELQAIKEAKPSEALKKLEGIEYVADILKVNHKIGSRDIANQEIKEMVDRLNYRIPIIKQALLKAEKLEKAWEIILGIIKNEEYGTQEELLKACEDVYGKGSKEFDLLKEMLV